MVGAPRGGAALLGQHQDASGGAYASKEGWRSGSPSGKLRLHSSNIENLTIPERQTMHSFRNSISFVPLAVVLVAGQISGLAGYKRINQPNPKDPMAVQIYELDNGLTVYLTENHETPRFHAEIAVRAGSKHDPHESTVLAHYLEHMLFKGTDKIGTIDYAKEKPHLDRIAELYEEHFKEKDPEKRQAIYGEINQESQLAAKYAIPNEMDKLYKAMGESGLNAHTYHEETVYTIS